MKKLVLLFIFSLVGLGLSAQSSLFGTVVDANGVPLAFAKITYEKDDVTAGVTTDLDGKYRVRLESGIYKVNFSTLGYNSVQYDSVIVEKDMSHKLDAILEEITALSEVVVVGRRYIPSVFIEICGRTFSDESTESSLIADDMMVEPPPSPTVKKAVAKSSAKRVTKDAMGGARDAIKAIEEAAKAAVEATDDSASTSSNSKLATGEMNDLLVRLFDQFTTIVSCEKKVVDKDLDKVVKIKGLVKANSSNEKFSCKLYPNPTYGQLNIKIKGDIKILFLTNSAGRILEHFNVEGRRKLKVDLSRYPAGNYQISYWGKNKRAVSGRVALVHD